MAAKTSHNDDSISEPSEDRFGIEPFAMTLAFGILQMVAPQGMVIALNGPWGSGKSSAVNLVRHHLADAVEAEEITIVDFACWWFRGEEELALAFFRELYAGLGPSLGSRFKKALPKLGARLLKTAGFVGPAIDMAGAAGAGTIASGAMSWASGLIKLDDSVEKLYAQISKALSDQDRRFLIVIDDIDRLAPDEALLIFRLIKSVGRLPNVIYLLVFDRALAEAIVKEKYPSEGPQYLEKIIQASFDIPEPRKEDLRDQMLENIEKICGRPNESELLQFMNVFYDVIAPEIRTPRDVIRLANSLSVTWPAIGREVDRADFIGIETFRLLRPTVYRAIRSSKELLVGGADSGTSRYSTDQKTEYDKILLGGVAQKDQEQLRRALKRLFPRLDSVWGNLSYGQDSLAGWERQRRVCAASRFDTYFRLSIGDDVLKKDEIDTLVENAADRSFVQQRLREALGILRYGGTTKAALILDELNLHAESIADEDVRPLLIAIFEIGDELDTPRDAAKGFSIGDNRLRIHWLLRRLILDRFDIDKRSAILLEACKTAPVGWMVDIADSANAAHNSREGRAPETQDRLITTKQDCEKMQAMALKSLRAAAKSGALSSNSKLPYLLYRWHDLAKDDGKEVKRWTKAQLARNDQVVLFANAFTSQSWSQSIADRVAQRTTLANVVGIEKILDVELFRGKIKSLLADETLPERDRLILSEFDAAWNRREKGDRY
ncbi:P-loop NTPase fold protein [Bradyrhizobium sp. AUGA SZCCT0283]|uniref:KAP family P-loop NTPase fold protein n=1 Tax=Bradyrhizobium sp. AUGA SZCCT0283 TaxID=2807671 RepID=UPI001BAA67F4|nr:P-loop NTPase fold protein [Bradyrhizobium sp. AUGA SZCCT0283]MBR1277752.1 AAA family ATPase [Bradyrhizobium sp. AUGA SZCCT0283]